MTSRNDDHGGDALRRMQIFVTSLLEQAAQHSLVSELVVVEWNPPSNRPTLGDALEWPAKTGSCTVRLIEVPSAIHQHFNHASQLPLFQMIAKNVGIRRARGRFVLATNIDILFSNDLMAFFASRRLRRGRMYRIDRYDVPATIPADGSTDARLAYCGANVIRVHTRDGSLVFDEAKSSDPPKALRLERRWTGMLRREPVLLHTNGCGDFTLMARDHWETIHGYAEFPMYSFRIDALLCYAAHFAGAQETMLRDPMRIYHIEHSPGSGWSPGKGAELLNQRLADAGIPQVSLEQKNEWIQQMQRDRRPIVFNDDNWGLARLDLPEIVLADRADHMPEL